jgi:sensor histidine kinase YesM
MGVRSFKDSRIENITMLIGVPIVGFLLTFIFISNENIIFFSRGHLFSVLTSIIVTAINWAGCRFIVVKLWSKYPWHLKPTKHIFIEIPVVIGFTIGLMSLMTVIDIKTSGNFFSHEIFWHNTFFVIILTLFIVSFHEALFFYYQWKENFNKSLVLEKANIKAEYDTLKSQINPHFLFNSLNTLISYVENNDVATKYVYNLSDFLRYTLDNKDTDIKLLRDELNLVRKYIYLQKSRFKEHLIIDIDIPEKYYHYTIPPLALQMLVDNAIKHNIISKDKPLEINIFIEPEIYIVVENNLQKRYETNSTKQGLINIKNRYAFLSEKDIIISEKNNKFTVKLPLVKTEI